MSEAPRQRTGPIGKTLYEAGVVTREQVTEALDVQRREGGKTFEILIRLGHLNKDDLHAVLSQQPGVASIDISRFKVSPEYLSLIPKELALKELVLPIDKMGKLLTVAMACPLDITTIEELESLTGLRVKAVLSKYDDIVAALEKYYPSEAQGEGELPTFELPSRHGAASTRNLTEEIKQLEMLAAAPGLLDKVMAASKDGADLKVLMQTASADPALAGWLLALANSPAYGMPSQVESLGLAVALLGAPGVRSAVELMKKSAPQPKSDFSEAYESTRTASLIAAALAKKSGKVERGSAFTAGLLRRLGWFVLATLQPGDYPNGQVGEVEFCEQERKRFGLSHVEAGAIMANRWRYPEALVGAIGASPVQEGASHPLAAVAVLSNLLAEKGRAQGAACLDGQQHHLAALAIDREAAFKEAEKILNG